MKKVFLFIFCVGLLTLLGAYFYIKKISSSELTPITSQQSSQSKPEEKIISSLIVPHHDLVKAKREEMFATVKDKINPKTVILISPNHYSSGRAAIQTTDKVWNITEGSINPNIPLIASLKSSGVDIETSSFENEHGIKNILSDIKNTFPEANIVPLIFKEGGSDQELADLANYLKKNCQDCLMIASVDFSHYQPALLGNLHDATSTRILTNLDTEAVLTKSEVDCPSCLNLLMHWAKDQDTLSFNEYAHTNSGELLVDPDGEGTTHVFGWYESGDQKIPLSSVDFIIGGDLMFGRSVAHRYLAGGLEKVFDQLGNRVFWGTDASIVNLEGPISTTPVPDNIQPNNLTFNFPPQAIDALKFLKTNAASLANNHSSNAGSKGLETTRELLKKANIQSIGGPGDSSIDQVGIFEGQGMKLYVIGVHTLISQPDLVPLIKKLKVDPTARVLVFPHWGVEYKYLDHTQGQVQLAHTWIDAGADIVIGAHPHVVEDTEIYKGKPIFYSLGNFVFDQYFSKETQQGLLVAGQFTPDGLDLFALPMQSKLSKPQLMTGEAKQDLLEKLYQPFIEFKTEEKAGVLLKFPLK